ncbi:2-oxoglutarate and iron-dependent oxygenase domain-containing protein [Ammonicoccus fulvus]|uniref:2-oxoglutarate and iron-dependent oxygenase domain-containing protein n=1 Tax=Ammonicoccus fulvus TaxID=3138240 RepID=A0ABZ3FMK2_9ACTN
MGYAAVDAPAPDAQVRSDLELPILDLSRADDPEQAAAFRRDLLGASHEVGFFYLTGTGVTAAETAELVRLTEAFFALPLADKVAIEMVNSPHYRGYTQLGNETTRGEPDWREQIDIGPERPALPRSEAEPWNLLQGPNQWPAALPELRPVIEAWQAKLEKVGLRLLREWAEALGQDRHVFDPAFATDPATLLKIVRYPSADTLETTSTQGVGPHKDSGFLTLLYVPPGQPGLQVDYRGQWLEATPLEGAFVVNIGEMLEVATNGLLKATVHRVQVPDPGRARISIPYFYNPNLSARVPILDLPEELQAYATGVTQDEKNLLFGTYGENALKSRLRAHRDVTERHHAALDAQWSARQRQGFASA